MFASNGVIWKQPSYCCVFTRKCRDSGISPESNGRNGPGAEVNNGNFTLQLRQRNPGVSPANFNATQCSQTMSIWPMRTKGASCNQLFNCIQMLLDSNQYLMHRARDYFIVDLYLELDDILFSIGLFLGLSVFAFLSDKLKTGPY